MNTAKQNALLTVGLMEEIDRLENNCNELMNRLARKEMLLKHANGIITEMEIMIDSLALVVETCGGVQ